MRRVKEAVQNNKGGFNFLGQRIGGKSFNPKDLLRMKTSSNKNNLRQPTFMV